MFNKRIRIIIMRMKILIIINHVKKMNSTIISLTRTMFPSKLLSKKLFNVVNITMFSCSKMNFISILIMRIKVVEQLKQIFKIDRFRKPY